MLGAKGIFVIRRGGENVFLEMILLLNGDQESGVAVAELISIAKIRTSDMISAVVVSYL